jgi:hypothetical protein
MPPFAAVVPAASIDPGSGHLRPGRGYRRRPRSVAAADAPQPAAHHRDGRAVPSAEIDDHVRERGAALRQDDDARATAAVLGAVHRVLAAVATNRDEPGGPELDRAVAEHGVAQPTRHPADQFGGQLGDLRRNAGRGRLPAGTERLPAAEQRVVIGRERRPLLPASPDGLALRRVGRGTRLILAQRVVPLLVGLLLATLLLLTLPGRAAARPPGARRPGLCRVARWSAGGFAPLQ